MFHIQPEDGHYQVPKHVVVLYVIIYISINPPDSCVRQQIHSNSSLQRHNGDDEPYESLKLLDIHVPCTVLGTLRTTTALMRVYM